MLTLKGNRANITSTTTQRDNEMTTYRITYKNNFARNLITLEAKDVKSLMVKLSNRCIEESQIVSIKEGF